ncbi:protein MEI2-like 2 [Lycium ferocissimum]|uniref:protein MEI2-like 2 n=1 Tax=Lycium ferocissimum TaxID=112874 RepID=UPI002816599A|nr:protein MEI2-like 2 [Lycium ferocissimum]XP_059284705.1 protein MEI2-like 2 [Lycium ferocissimum]XP_059284706.1 protein MEI2-like 2 [Lycium ferocissimum]XP_059284707.1 protein MEI2-like 2 [Lycium ferocissimum]
MEKSLKKLISDDSEVPSAKTSGTEMNAWKIPLFGTAAHHASTDASLFSSSLPVLPHAKLNFTESENYGQSIDDSSPSIKDPLEEEPIPDGCLLPGDEDELLAGIMDDFDLSGLPTQLEDLDDDFFGSGGGLELETESLGNSLNGFAKLSMSDGILGNSVGHHVFPNSTGTVAGEHPYGEHPSRTLFVRNINSNVEDSELRSLFEQYGDIRTLYTSCKHRGFVMISYYDIRAARTAMRVLQHKPLRRRKLDIHFSIPKENPSEKDVNQGTLVIFNLDPSVSNEDLLQIFGAYGEVKEIRETPHKRHHKFIEFYDVRAAEAALKALNRSDIAGKRIKLEPSRPGGARRSLIQQLSQDYEHEEARTFRHSVGSPIASSPPGSWSNFGSPVEPSSLLGYNQSPGLRNLSPVNGNHMPGLASILPGHFSSPKIAPIGKDPGRLGPLNHAITSPKSVQGVGYQHSYSVPEHKPHLNFGSMSLGEPKSSGIGTLSGPQFLWGSTPVQSERTDSSVWSNSSLAHPFASNGQGQGYPYSHRQGLFLGSHHVGSAPSGIPLDRRLGFFSESPETSYMNQVAYGSSGSSHNNGSHVMSIGSLGAMNMSVSPSSRMMSLPRNGPLFFGNGSYGGIGMANNEGAMERGRSRRVESGNEIDNKKQYLLDLEKIMSGEDTRTTLMIKNIPNKYTSKMLLTVIDETHKNTYDFLYLPIDFKNKCNVGYAFINMVSPSHIISFYEAFNGKKWEKFNSEKVASLAYARIQGKTALVAHFQNSSLMNEDKRCRPILFRSEGQEAADQEPLPSNNLNICVRLPDGSYSGDSLDSPKGDLDEKLYIIYQEST